MEEVRLSLFNLKCNLANIIVERSGQGNESRVASKPGEGAAGLQWGHGCRVNHVSGLTKEEGSDRSGGGRAGRVPKICSRLFTKRAGDILGTIAKLR